MKNLEEKAFSTENNTSDDAFDYSVFKFPLDNSEFCLTNPNLGINEKLNNVFFIEFDLDSNNISKEHLKAFREINNDFVEKEIHFVLNVWLFIFIYRELFMANLYSKMKSDSQLKQEDL